MERGKGAAKRMPDEDDAILSMHCRNGIPGPEQQPAGIILKPEIGGVGSGVGPFQKVDGKAALSTRPDHAGAGNEIEYVTALDRTGDEKQRWPGAFLTLESQEPQPGPLGNHPARAAEWTITQLLKPAALRSAKVVEGRKHHAEKQAKPVPIDRAVPSRSGNGLFTVIHADSIMFLGKCDITGSPATGGGVRQDAVIAAFSAPLPGYPSRWCDWYKPRTAENKYRMALYGRLRQTKTK